jgi:hypothetical protein
MMNFVLPEEHTIFENEILSILTLLWTFCMTGATCGAETAYPSGMYPLF